LSTAQYARLQPLMDKAVDDYLPDLSRFFSNDWHLQSYYVLLPVRGIPEQELKSILTPQQWELCNSQDLAKHGDYWTSIQQYHDQRVKNSSGGGRPRTLRVNVNGGGVLVLPPVIQKKVR